MRPSNALKIFPKALATELGLPQTCHSLYDELEHVIVEVQDESDKNNWQIAFFVFRLLPEKADNLVNRELAKNNKERKKCG